jgi:flagellar protein FliS
MAQDTASAYLTTKVMTASPEELRLMLLDGAIKFTRQGREGLAAKNFEMVHHGFSRARSILLELVNSMRREVDPALCDRLSGLYMFMFRELFEAGHSRDVARADKVIELLEYDRETWLLLIEQLVRERQASQGIRERVAAGQPAQQAAPGGEGYSPLSISG